MDADAAAAKQQQEQEQLTDEEKAQIERDWIALFGDDNNLFSTEKVGEEKSRHNSFSGSESGHETGTDIEDILRDIFPNSQSSSDDDEIILTASEVAKLALNQDSAPQDGTATNSPVAGTEPPCLPFEASCGLIETSAVGNKDKDKDDLEPFTMKKLMKFINHKPVYTYTPTGVTIEKSPVVRDLSCPYQNMGQVEQEHWKRIEALVDESARDVISNWLGFQTQQWDPAWDTLYSGLLNVSLQECQEIAAKGPPACLFNDYVSGKCWKLDKCKFLHPIGKVEGPKPQPPPVFFASTLPKKLGSETQIGVSMRAKVSHVVSPFDFYVVPVNTFSCMCRICPTPGAAHDEFVGIEGLEKLKKDIAKCMAVNFVDYQADEYSANQLVACLVSVDGSTINGRLRMEWQRGVVLQPARANLKPTFPVWFIDVGKRFDASFVYTAALPEKFSTIAPMAYHCCLDGIVPVEDKFSEKALQFFENLVLGKTVWLQITDLISNSGANNKLIFQETPYPVELRTLLPGSPGFAPYDYRSDSSLDGTDTSEGDSDNENIALCVVENRQTPPSIAVSGNRNSGVPFPRPKAKVGKKFSEAKELRSPRPKQGSNQQQTPSKFPDVKFLPRQVLLGKPKLVKKGKGRQMKSAKGRPSWDGLDSGEERQSINVREHKKYLKLEASTLNPEGKPAKPTMEAVNVQKVFENLNSIRVLIREFSCMEFSNPEDLLAHTDIIEKNINHILNGSDTKKKVGKSEPSTSSLQEYNVQHFLKYSWSQKKKPSSNEEEEVVKKPTKPNLNDVTKPPITNVAEMLAIRGYGLLHGKFRFVPPEVELPKNLATIAYILRVRKVCPSMTKK